MIQRAYAAVPKIFVAFYIVSLIADSSAAAATIQPSTPSSPAVSAQCSPPSPLVSHRWDFESPGTPQIIVLENHKSYVIPSMAFGAMGIVLHDGDPIQICARVPGRNNNQIGGRCAFVYDMANGTRAQLCPPETPSPAPIPTP